MIETKITGLPDLREALRGLAPKLRVRALRNALAAGAREVRKTVRAKVPLLDPTNPASLAAQRANRRKPATVRNAVSVRTSKLARRQGDVGVFVNVRPAKPGARGANKPTDPFYWRFINFGWTPATKAHGAGLQGKRHRRTLNHQGAAKAVPGARFLEAGAARLPEALQVFLRAIGPQIAKLNRPKAPAP